ncbi:hypothetical protein [Acetobacter thailandicus]|uniref:RiboL-PSP-HEPN domain-containing protein n=1 Tax=Acetobacter thailandicus TaxID=1502842 RepID=A0ABT3QCI7_9PROT|nr:hypothetical protein [Acetobacter thailandicus]MCX2562996.1 hypothetical protein [Acetobacter thailandicus]NHN96229.1 hypothetical protein [Acetobacter thailandicus]
MSENTEFYNLFCSGISERKRALIFKDGEDDYFFPPLGNEWDADFVENTKCDAFILFFVAELENYFESIIEAFMKRYEGTFKGYFLKNCSAGEGYILAIQSKIRDISKNHNTNWQKISPLFSFIGMSKERHFPQDYWDEVDNIVSHRGHVAHNGMHLRVETDRRIFISQIKTIIDKTNQFDKKVFEWLSSVDIEMERLSALSNLSFSPNYI